jgi:hypothetical protein
MLSQGWKFLRPMLRDDTWEITHGMATAFKKTKAIPNIHIQYSTILCIFS